MELAVETILVGTQSGRLVDVVSPDPDMIDLRDIAHALSNICRFGGHTSRHYSVAEHSIYVADLMAKHGLCEQHCAIGLMHDATEAYLGDVCSPLKSTALMDHYRDLEYRVSKAIASRFDLWPAGMTVKHHDTVLLWCEAYVLMPHGVVNWPGYGSYGSTIIADHREVCDWIRDASAFVSYRHGPKDLADTFVRRAGILGVE